MVVLGYEFKRDETRVKMSDPLIEGITHEEPKPGLVENVKDSVKNYILPTSIDTEEIEEKRESLAILASLGTPKDYLGVQVSLGDVKKLTPKDVKKYYYRYQSVLSKQVTGGLVENGIKLASKTISRFIPIDDPDSLSNDLVQDEIVKRELVDAAGYLVLKGGRFVALASALFHIMSHVDFTVERKILEEPPEDEERPFSRYPPKTPAQVEGTNGEES